MSLLFGGATSHRVNLAAGVDNVNAFTILMWVYITTDTSLRRLFSKGANDKNLFLGYTSATDLAFYVERGSGVTSSIVETTTAAFTLNAWNFIACTFDDAEGVGPHIYRGTLTTAAAECAYRVGYPVVGSGTIDDDSGTPWVIGNDGSSILSIPGRIAFFAHYNKRLTLQEVIAYQFKPIADGNCDIFMHLGFAGTGTQPNWSTLGQGITGTVTGATVDAHVPLAPFFGSIGGWRSPQPPFIEQEGFAFGDDDGSESTHTLATQDTNITALLGVKTLRALINSEGDPSAIGYTLKSQKNGAGGYATVPLVSSSDVTPTPVTDEGTESGNNTASASWAVSYPSAVAGDLLIFGISWDDSTTTTDVAEPAGPNGETLSEVVATPPVSSNTAVRCKVWYTIATGTWTASTLTFTPTASEQWQAGVVKIPAGQFDAATPIGASTTAVSALVTETDLLSPAFSAGASDGGGRLFCWTAADTDPQTLAADWTQIANNDIGAVSGAMFTRVAAVTDSESIASDTVSTIAGGDWCSISFVVRPYVQINQVYVSASANVAAGGEATTARLTAPSGKTTSDFDTGRRWDNENGTDTLDITTDDYTEVEWVLTTQSPAVTTDYFEFRVYKADVALTYTVTPKWTIGTGAGSQIKTINGLAIASAKTVNGLAIASVKTWNGLA